MKPRAPFFTALLLGAFLPAQNAAAHSPFDASSRVIVHADAAEVSVMVGAALGEKFLRAGQLTPGQLPNGHPFALNPEMATNFFATSADDKILQPREADVITDGIEFQFHFEYALAPAKSLRLESKFLAALNGSRTASLVLTDENGNILGSAILTPGKEVAEFALPAPAPALRPPSPPLGERDGVRGTATNPVPEKLSTAPMETKPVPSFVEFLKLGISHILNVEAFDHLLFLLALLLGCRKLKTMLLVVTGFTVAHSLTLTLAALNLVNLSPRLVEPAIAASIIFVALENFRRAGRNEDRGLKMEDGGEPECHPPSSILHPRSPNTLRYALTCGFGLIHGFGFASALRASGLAGTGAEIVKPLVAFNAGVEVGQLVVAAVVLPLLLLLNRWPWFVRNGARMISALVILVAVLWLRQRLAP